jgi:subtilisin-like proprotein convertase family protein
VAPASAATRSFTKGPISRDILDSSVTVSTLRVGTRGRIQDLDVLILVTHTFDSDLTIGLMGPSGRVVTLASDDGADGNNFGSGEPDCDPPMTRFDDEAATSINDGTAPFDGPFSPEEPLSRFDGKQLQGKWRLLIADGEDGDTGTLYCWKMRARYNP